MGLLLAGAAIDATFVAPVAAQVTNPSTTTTYTRSASCAGLDFYPTDSDTRYSNDSMLRYSIAGSGTKVFRCDPGVPNGAVVIKVQFTLFDGEGGSAVAGPCDFVRSGLTTGGAASSQLLASVRATVNDPGTVRFTDTTIQYATINNASYGYWFECHLDPGDGYGKPGLYGADVIYTITAAKG